MRIAIDCDEVLAGTVDAILAFHKNRFNDKPITRNEVTTFLWNELEGYHASESYAKAYREEFFQSESGKKIPPLYGAQAGVHALKQAGHSLVVVTSRRDTTHEFTKVWIETHFPQMFDDVIFGASSIDTHYTVNKGELMTYLGTPYLVDDALHNCTAVAMAGHEALLLDNPRNQLSELPEKITRVSDWQQIVEYFNLIKK